jgi:hypothetical protein
MGEQGNRTRAGHSSFVIAGLVPATPITWHGRAI